MRPIEIYAAAIVPALVLAISASAGQLVRFEAPVGGLDGAPLEICTSAGGDHTSIRQAEPFRRRPRHLAHGLH